MPPAFLSSDTGFVIPTEVEESLTPLSSKGQSPRQYFAINALIAGV